MKKVISLAICCLFLLSAFAQSPQAIPYQAIIRNNDGTVMSNTALSLTFKIHDSSATGTIVYDETHSTSSNSLGLVSVNVGGGSPVSGTFSSINWSNGAKYLQVLMNAGNGDIDLGTQQMLSVPYALYAENSGSGTSTVSTFQGSIGKGFTMISQSLSPTPLTLAGSIDFCYNLEEQGYNDWRLPTLEEALSYVTNYGPQTITRNMWTLTVSTTNLLNFAQISAPINNPTINGYFRVYNISSSDNYTTTCVR